MLYRAGAHVNTLITTYAPFCVARATRIFVLVCQGHPREFALLGDN